MQNETIYVAVGDSLTCGVGASAEEHSFPFQYFQSLKTTHSCKYTNLGCSGMNSTELQQYLEKKNIKKIWRRATDITITIGGNDLIRTYRANGSAWHFLVTTQKLKWNLHRIISNIKTHNPRVHILIMGLYNPGIPTHPHYHRLNTLIQRVNHMYACLSNKYSVDFIDPFHYFLDRTHLLADEIHPNDEGYRKISELFVAKRNQLSSQLNKNPVYP
ncbi:SGNH/GDSL hydrolase family protein [Alteribacter populi]|uniref:SGNH/GDSL hydrolase family protein n=1 Tax=Alteribacter populi TaxID=2011011 RepID=UPI000BBA825D|nr:GDSL-type esterase/lipase family protein [Alteribacter populi]